MVGRRGTAAAAEEEPRSRRNRIPTFKATQEQPESSSSSSSKKGRVSTPVLPPSVSSERASRSKVLSAAASTSSPYKPKIDQGSNAPGDGDDDDDDQDEHTRKRNLRLSKNESSPSSSGHRGRVPIRNPSSPRSRAPVVEISSVRSGKLRAGNPGRISPSPSPSASPARGRRSLATQGQEQNQVAEKEQVLTPGPLAPKPSTPTHKGKARALNDEADPRPAPSTAATTPTQRTKRKAPSSAQSSQASKRAKAALNPPVISPQQLRQLALGKGTASSSAQSPTSTTKSTKGAAIPGGSSSSKVSPVQKNRAAVHSEGIPMAATSDRRKKGTTTLATAAVTPTKNRLRADLLNSGSGTRMVHGSSPLRGTPKSAARQKKVKVDEEEFSEDEDALPSTPTGNRDRRQNGATIEAELRGSQQQQQLQQLQKGLSNLISPSSSATRDRTTAALIENSSSDAFFEAYSPSRKSRTPKPGTSPESTPKHKRQKKRARLADGIDALDRDNVGQENGGASMSSTAALKLQNLQDRGTGLEILSHRSGLMRKDTIEGLFPFRKAGGGGGGGGEEEEAADEDEEGLDIWEQWKQKWGSVNLPHRPAVVPERARQEAAGWEEDDAAPAHRKRTATASPARQGRSGRPHQPSAADQTTVLIPPFATHTLQALTMSHFRGTPSTLIRPNKHQPSASRQAGPSSSNDASPTNAPNSKFAMWLAQLHAGFSLVFWGVGIGVLPESLADPPPELFPPCHIKSVSASMKQQQQQRRSGLGTGSTHLLNTFIRDVCASGHGCAWIGHGLAAAAVHPAAAGARAGSTSSVRRATGAGTSMNGGLRIEDVLAGCEGAVCDAWKYGDGDEEEDAAYGTELPALDESGFSSQSQRLEARARRLAALFSGPVGEPGREESKREDEEGQRFDSALHTPAKTAQRREACALPPALFILIHSLDASPNMVSPTAQHILTVLGSASRIHLLGTVRNVNAALAVPFGTGSGAAATPSSGRGRENVEAGPDAEEGRNRSGCSEDQNRLRWVWHCISTFVPSLPEAYTGRHGALVGGVPAQLDFTGCGGLGPTVAAIRTALGHDQDALAAYSRYHEQLSAAARRRRGGGATDGLPTFAEVEAGLEHVLRSVAPRVRTLFLILAWEQLQTCPAAEDGDHQDGLGDEDEDRDDSRGAAGRGVTINRIVELGSRAIMGLKMGEVQPLLNEFETHHMLEWRHHRSGGDRAAMIRLSRAVLKGYVDRLDRGAMGPVNLRVESLEAAKRREKKA